MNCSRLPRFRSRRYVRGIARATYHHSVARWCRHVVAYLQLPLFKASYRLICPSALYHICEGACATDSTRTLERSPPSCSFCGDFTQEFLPLHSHGDLNWRSLSWNPMRKDLNWRPSCSCPVNGTCFWALQSVPRATARTRALMAAERYARARFVTGAHSASCSLGDLLWCFRSWSASVRCVVEDVNICVSMPSELGTPARKISVYSLDFSVIPKSDLFYHSFFTIWPFG